jgi:extradiol dioxygenase family protein
MKIIDLQKPDVTRFHLSLNVNDLGKSVQFLTALLGCSPRKLRNDYAKFEPSDLPLVLSLEPRAEPQQPLRNTAGEGPLNHVGIRMTNATQLVDVQRRLEASGYATQREEGVECCYARQTKFWVLDHDRTMWEVYVLDEDIEHRGNAESTVSSSVASDMVCSAKTFFEPRRWSHRLSDDFPDAIPSAGQLDEVLLQGSWNAKKHMGQWSDQLVKARSALRPGGKLVVHLLTAGEAIMLTKPLPGPASVVEVVPTLSEVFSSLETQGFQHLRLAKYGASPCFLHEGVEMRETRLEAFAPQTASAEESLVRVLYRGPCFSIALDGLDDFKRGEPRWISVEAWEQLVAMHGSDSFVKLADSSCLSPAHACTG